MFFLFQQPNFKQKFVALLKRFKVTDEVSVKNINKIIIIGLHSEQRLGRKMVNVKPEQGALARFHGVDHETQPLYKMPLRQKDVIAARTVFTMCRRVAAMCA